MLGRPRLPLWLFALFLLALVAQSPSSVLGLSEVERVTPAIREQSGHRALPGVVAQALAVLPDPAAVRGQVLGPGKVFTTARVLSRALAVLPKVSDIHASPKPTPAPEPEPDPRAKPRASQTRSPPVVATQTPTLPQTLPAILMPLSASIGSQTPDMPSLVRAPAPLALQTTTTSLVPAPASTASQISAVSSVPVQDSTTAPQTTAASSVPDLTSVLSEILISSQIPASPLKTAKAILAASLVPTQALASTPISSLVCTQTLTSSPKSPDASSVPTQTSPLIQTLAPSLVPIQTSVSFLPLATPKNNPPTTPTLLPMLPQNPTVNMMPTQVSKLSQTKVAPVVHTATPTLSPVMPQTMPVLLVVPAPTLVAPQAPVPTTEHTWMAVPLLPLSVVSGKAPNQPPQALVPTQTSALPPVPQKQWQILTSTQALTQTLAPPPEFTIPLTPPPEPPPKPTKLCSPSPEMTKVLLPPPKLKPVPVSVLSSTSIQTPTMLLNNIFPSPPVSMVERPLAHNIIPPSLVPQKNIQEINFLCLGPCTCKAGTLSCTGLSPELRLHSVPAPGPKAHNLTFFSLDFHGNSISIIERGIWKSYPWAETLNLKDNALHKLHKDSFEGLLSLQHLDLSCNKIHVIERCAFEPLPFLQFLNLGCNLLKKLSYGTFQAWHGMQLLQKLILSHNPLSAIEDTSFFQLPSLKYLDISRTDVPLMAIENILVMALRLQTLVLPSNTACCLCQFKKNIESLFKTTKLQCESKCFTNSSLCDQKESIDDMQEEFISTLQSRKKNTSIELSIQPERAYVDSDVSALILPSEQLNSNGETDLLDAVKYLLPKLLKGQVKSVELKLFPFIKLLHAHSRNGEETSGPSTNPSSWSSFGPIRINLTDEIQLRKLYFVTNLLEAYLREKMYPIQNKREKMVQAKHPTLRKKWNTFGLERGGKCGMAPGKCSQPPASSSGEAAAPTRGLALASAPRADACTGRFCPRKKSVTVGKVSSRERSMGGKHSERTDPQSFQGKWESVESSLEKFAKGRTRASALAMRRLSSRLKKPGWHRVDIPSTAKPLAVSLEDRRKSGGLTYPISASKSVNKRLKYKGQKENHGIGRAFHKDHIPVFRSNKKHFLHKAKSRITNKFPEAKHSQGLKNKLAQNRWLFENPVFTGTRSLINNPSKKDISLSPKRRMPAKASKGTTPAKASEVPPTRNTTSENTPASSKKKEEFTLLGDSLPAVQLTNETRWEHQGNPESLPEPNSNSSFNFSASTDSFEIELNQRLQPLIPNDEMRSLISHVVRTLQKDCREPRVQLACAKLISKTGHLMKLLSDGQKMNQSPAHQNPDPGKQENYLNDSTSLQMALGQLQTDELKKDIPEFGYNNKLLLAISVTVVVMIIIAVVCLIEICSHRPTTSKGDIKYSYSLRSFLTSLHKKSSRRSPEEEGNFYRKGKPLWLRDMYRPLDATRKKNMAQKLHDQDSSDEDEIFNKERRNEAIEKREEKRKNEED